MEENKVIVNEAEVAEAAGAAVGTACATKKIGVGEGAILGFAGVGVLATGYGLYKLIKWGIGKVKAGKAAKEAPKAEEAKEEAKAEEPTAE